MLEKLIPSVRPISNERSHKLAHSHQDSYSQELEQRMNRSLDVGEFSRSRKSRKSEELRQSRLSLRYSQPEISSHEHFSNVKIIEQINSVKRQKEHLRIPKPEGDSNNMKYLQKDQKKAENENRYIMVQEGNQQEGYKSKANNLNRSFPNISALEHNIKDQEDIPRNSLRSQGSKPLSKGSDSSY
jgi:hypothetical protein